MTVSSTPNQKFFSEGRYRDVILSLSSYIILSIVKLKRISDHRIVEKNQNWIDYLYKSTKQSGIIVVTCKNVWKYYKKLYKVTIIYQQIVGMCRATQDRSNVFLSSLSQENLFSCYFPEMWVLKGLMFLSQSHRLNHPTGKEQCMSEGCSIFFPFGEFGY